MFYKLLAYSIVLSFVAVGIYAVVTNNYEYFKGLCAGMLWSVMLRDAGEMLRNREDK